MKLIEKLATTYFVQARPEHSEIASAQYFAYIAGFKKAREMIADLSIEIGENAYLEAPVREILSVGEEELSE